ncbi:GOLPH3/VPS74 family protein [Paenibacillus ginsengarvi]|nr:GPP34 family phosphoprotein [Paenibacillus ginsengarvi]
MTELSLSEQYLLLALDASAHKFGLPARQVMQTFACGAAVAELMLLKRLRLHEDGRLEVVDATPTGYAGTDLLLAELTAGASGTTIRKWIHSIYSRRRLRDLLFEASLRPLLEGDLMSAEQRKLLFVFASTRYTPHPGAIARIVQRIRAELLDQGTEADDKTALLVMLLDSSKLLKAYFFADELDRLRAGLKLLHERNRDRFGVIRQTRRTIDEIHVVMVTTASM